tara:strand:+ start:1235 stop:1621 length:387 start_codon:yes stop_codon:yes gene_type:complete
MIEEFSITIKKINRPKGSNLNQDIQIISQSLGLFTKRDKEKSCFRVFIEILKNKGLTAEEITISTNLTRATIIHHLNSLIKNGLVVKKKHKYYLRGNNLEGLIKEVSKDMDRTFNDLNRLAKNIDRNL